MKNKQKNRIILSDKPKRNYQFVQFLLDFFALLLLYINISVPISEIGFDLAFNANVVVARGAEEVLRNPYLILIWSAAAVLIFAAGIIMPLVFRRKTKLNQKQYDMWVYAVMLVRILAMIIVFEIMAKHLSYISLRYPTEGVVSFKILSSLVLIAILVRFTQIRIKAAEPKKTEEPKRAFTED